MKHIFNILLNALPHKSAGIQRLEKTALKHGNKNRIKTISPTRDPPLFSKDSTDLGTLHNFAQYSSVSFANSNKRHVSINIQRFKTFIAFFRSSITTDIINTLPPSTALAVFNAYVCRRFLYLLT